MSDVENTQSKKQSSTNKGEDKPGKPLTVLPPESAIESTEEHLPSARDTTIEIVELLRDMPQEKIQAVVDGAVKITESTNLPLISAKSEARLRHIGMWIGAGMTISSIAGAVAVLLSSAPALIGVALFILGAACAGATYALISGARVTPQDFVNLLDAAKRAISIEGKEEDQ